MPKLREGDIVTFTARVTRVADYDEDQQIMAKILPNGEEIGWCLPKENAFKPHTLVVKVGDTVRRINLRTGESGFSERYTVKAIFNDGQIAVQKLGCWPVEILKLENLERI